MGLGINLLPAPKVLNKYFN